MVIRDKGEIVSILNGKPSGHRGWFAGDCPFCGKKGHLAFIFGKEISSFVCKKCGESGTLWVLLNEIGRLDLLERNKTVNLSEKLVNKIKEEFRDVDLELPNKTLPIGSRVLKQDDYLDSRGFTPEQYELFKPCYSLIDPKVKNDYVVFPVYEDGEVKGWLARSRKSKEWISDYNEARPKGQRYLRYQNSVNTDFGKMIYGIEEITENTHTIIGVEGATDKLNVDRLLHLYQQEELKCGAFFGKKISIEQMLKLFNKGIRKVILLFDPDAVKESKQYVELLTLFFEVEVGHILDDKDPGDLNQEEMLKVMDELKDPLEYKLNVISKNTLR